MLNQNVNIQSEVFSGEIKRMFRDCPKPDGWFGCFFETRKHGDIKLTGVTNLPLEDGMMLEITAHQVKKYGDVSWVADDIKIKTDDRKSIVALLSSSVFQGIGQMTARRIYDEFGANCFEVIKNEPERLYDIPSMTANKVTALREGLQGLDLEIELITLCPKFTAKERSAIIEKYGDKTTTLLKSNPYRILYDFKRDDDGVSFEFPKVDDIALGIGLPAHSMERVYEALSYTAVQMLEETGDSYLSLSDNNVYQSWLFRTRENLSNAPVHPFEISQKASSIKDWGKMVLIQETNGLGQTEYLLCDTVGYEAEKTLARFIAKKTTEDSLLNTTESEIRTWIDGFEKHTGKVLDDIQRQAVVTSLLSRISVITGGPGRGKTMVVECIAYCFGCYFRSNNYISLDSITLCAPTGKAVARMKSVKNSYCNEPQTIDRLIWTTSKPFSSRLVIIDEVSMVGFRKMAAFSSLLKNAQVIFIGDPDQLPSIEQGDVLKDLLAMPQIKSTKLIKCYRTAKDGKVIIENAEKVNVGNYNLVSDNNFFMRYDNDDENSRAMLIAQYAHYMKNGGYGSSEIAVLCPMKKGVLGSTFLNYELQRIFNKDGKPVDNTMYFVDKNLKTTFRVGDRVMQIENDKQKQWFMYDNNRKRMVKGTGVYNGDVGTITGVDYRFFNSDPYMTVLMDDGREVSYEPDEYDELTLAYAMTIHKSQGSEYPIVLLACPQGLVYTQGTFASRNLLYTGMTRAKEVVEIIGSVQGVNRMIGTKIERRRTRLCQMVNVVLSKTEKSEVL